MHCCRRQQRMVAQDAIQLLGQNLFSYDELLTTGASGSLSPNDLRLRVLCKGKVKVSKRDSTSPPDQQTCRVTDSSVRCRANRRMLLTPFVRSCTLKGLRRSSSFLSRLSLSNSVSLDHQLSVKELRAQREADTAPGALYTKTRKKQDRAETDSTSAGT